MVNKILLISVVLLNKSYYKLICQLNLEMNQCIKFIFYVLIAYPLLGYLTISYFGIPPYYASSVLIAVVFVNFISIKKGRIIFPKYLKVFALYLIANLISVYVANATPLQIDNFLGYHLYILNPLLLFLMIENINIPSDFIRKTRKLMKYLLLSSVIISIIQYFSPNFFIYSELYTGLNKAGEPGYARRIFSIFTWGDFNGSTYLSIGLMAMYGLLVIEYRHSKILSVLLPIAAGLIVFLSQMRVAMLSFVIVTLFLVFKKLRFKAALYLILFVIAGSLLIDVLNFNLDYFIENRLLSETAGTRIEAITAFLYAFPENPYFGTGGVRTETLYEGYGRVARLHNGHLAVAYYYGLITFIPYVWFVYLLAKKTYRTAKKSNYWPPFVGVIIFFIASATTPRAVFFIPGLIIMMAYHKYYSIDANYKRNMKNRTD